MNLTDELAQLICELVRIESVNPDLVPSGSGEAELAAFVASWLKDAGLKVETFDAVAGRPSVVGVLGGSGGGPSLMLNAHMDTVGAGGMQRPFEPVVRDGRVYGRGAYDMKGSLAAIMLAAREARALGLQGDLIVTAVADEEVASVGTAGLVERYNAGAAIVTEPTELRLCLAHKGFVWLDVETRGVAAHGSRADVGVDAIAAMGPTLSGVSDLARELATRAAHPLLGHGSIHASLIEGGREMSTYPELCIARLERRTLPGETGASVRAEVEAVAGDRAQVRVTLDRSPSEVDRTSPVALAVAEAAGEPEVIGVAYWMDMALLNAAGIPCVCFGPAGEGAHADVEWVDLASIETCVRVYLRAAELLTRA